MQVASAAPAVAQRYSVLLTTDQTPGAYWMRAGLDTTAFTYSAPDTQTEIRGVIRYGVSNDTMPDTALLANPPALPSGSPGALDITQLVPVGGGPAADPTVTVYMEVSMQYSAGSNDQSNQYLAFMNQTSYAPLEGTTSLFQMLGNGAAGSNVYDSTQLITTIEDVAVVEMIVQNYDDGDHPFHLHGYKFDVLGGAAGVYSESGRSVLNNTAPMLRDTHVIPAYSWVVLRFTADNPGFWTFHCHIQWHMAAGMVMQFSVLPSQAAQFSIPQYMIDQCSQ